jgi:hypothetical protein
MPPRSCPPSYCGLCRRPLTDLMPGRRHPSRVSGYGEVLRALGGTGKQATGQGGGGTSSKSTLAADRQLSGFAPRGALRGLAGRGEGLDGLQGHGRHTGGRSRLPSAPCGPGRLPLRLGRHVAFEQRAQRPVDRRSLPAAQPLDQGPGQGRRLGGQCDGLGAGGARLLALALVLILVLGRRLLGPRLSLLTQPLLDGLLQRPRVLLLGQFDDLLAAQPGLAGEDLPLDLFPAGVRDGPGAPRCSWLPSSTDRSDSVLKWALKLSCWRGSVADTTLALPCPSGNLARAKRRRWVMSWSPSLHCLPSRRHVPSSRRATTATSAQR